jgi:D-alanyl-D-alanine carboxypeptidase
VRHALIGLARRSLQSLRLAAIAFTAVAVGVSAAQANSKYAAIVVDANTGKTLFAASADAPRYPASLTKMMTLYMTFEALEKGKLKKSSKIVFSKNAAAEPPTKLGVKAGGSITVETAILALVTKSANDAATALGEHLGGSEEAFARMMTTKAHQLGMKGTIFRNANGLPNAAQRSTARDMAILGIALREHFPQHYSYFSTRSFKYGKQRLANHNRLLGRVKGVDGIKTGYTRASGFNLVSSVSDGNRKIVAVVMGGQSGASRDKHMQQLIASYMPKASTKRGGNLVAATKAEAPVAQEKKPSPLAAFANAILPKRNAPKPAVRPQEEIEVAAVQPEPFPMEQGTVEVQTEAMEQAFAEPIPERMGLDPIKTASIPAGWAIQIASSPSQGEAKQALDRASQHAVVADASAYTVPFDKDGVTYHRARFGGFGSKDAAWKACNALKKKKFDCYAVQQ